MQVVPSRTSFGSGGGSAIAERLRATGAQAATGQEPTAGGRFQGLEQFPARSTIGGVTYCIAGPRPYALEFANEFDVVCLLLGDIAGRSRFDDDREAELVFMGESAAFHPGGGNVRVLADQVRHGFIAFGYSPAFQQEADDRSLAALRRAGTRNNLRHGEIRHLARYVRERIRSGQRFEPLELQSLATLTYLYTLRNLQAVEQERAGGLSAAQFQRLCDYIDADMAGEISCSSLARVVGLPMRQVVEGIRARTGKTPYRFVVERRLEQACSLLRTTDLAISDIAFACGFSSQQHLTSTMSTRLGRTPLRIRQGD